jgi:hypothetical protein
MGDDEEEKTATAPIPAVSPGRTRRHAADVHLLSAAFFFVFSAYLPTQNLQSTLNTVRTVYNCTPTYVGRMPSFCSLM